MGRMNLLFVVLVETGKRVVIVALAAALLTVPLRGQEKVSEPPASALEVRELRQLVEQLQAKVANLEKQTEKQPGNSIAKARDASDPAAAQEVAAANPLTTDDRGTLDFLRGTTINLGIDGYYGYNFNRPTGRVNLL